MRVTRWRPDRVGLFCACLPLVLSAAPARAQEPQPQRGQKEWGAAAGYGFSVHLNRGRTEEHVVLFEPWFGYRLSRRFQYTFEAHFAQYLSPRGYMLGVMPFGLRFFPFDGEVQPYASVGGGLGWTNLTQLIEIDRRFNFLLQGSVGVRGPLGPDQGWSLESRLAHISNAGTVLPNLGLNSVIFLAGWRFK